MNSEEADASIRYGNRSASRKNALRLIVINNVLPSLPPRRAHYAHLEAADIQAAAGCRWPAQRFS